MRNHYTAMLLALCAWGGALHRDAYGGQITGAPAGHSKTYRHSRGRAVYGLGRHAHRIPFCTAGWPCRPTPTCWTCAACQ